MNMQQQNKVFETSRAQHKRLGKSKIIQQLEIQSMILPAVVFLFIFSYIPIYGIQIAFKDFNLALGITQSPWAGLKYFQEFLTDPALGRVLRNTICMNLLYLVIGFPAPIIFALMLMELRNPGYKKVVQTISYLPHFLSWVIFGGLMIDMLAPDGVLNTLLVSIGLLKQSVNFMAKGEYFYFIYILIVIIKNIGFGSILYVAAITGVPPELYEAATVDGANRFQRMWHITIPCIIGTICIMFIFDISSLLNSGIEEILVLQNSLNLPYSETIDTYVYKVGIKNMRFSYSSAVALFKSLISVILLIGANTLTKKTTEQGLF